uniref:(northern house mosquito) hypothetical protein n=1 Tax=Culex pipiens TaxID=7175 RepID=A0A8D8CV00_CULPI
MRNVLHQAGPGVSRAGATTDGGGDRLGESFWITRRVLVPPRIPRGRSAEPSLPGGRNLGRKRADLQTEHLLSTTADNRARAPLGPSRAGHVRSGFDRSVPLSHRIRYRWFSPGQVSGRGWAGQLVRTGHIL